jgi:hypothetical protein
MTKRSEQEQQEWERHLREMLRSPHHRSPEEELAIQRHNLEELQKGKYLSSAIGELLLGFGKDQFIEAIPAIEQFLTNEDPQICSAALRSLTHYFKLQEHWETACRFLLDDPGNMGDCRDAGIYALEDLRQSTGDIQTLNLLAPVVCDITESLVTRKIAYVAMRTILSQKDPRATARIILERFVLERHADWEMINSYLTEEGKAYLERRTALMAEEMLMRQNNLQNKLKRMQQGDLHGRDLLRSISYFGEQRYSPAIPELKRLLNSDDSQVRATALKTLTMYFGLEELWETTRHILLSDPDEQYRIAAAESLAYLHLNTGNRQTLSLLASIVRDEQASEALRKMAYASMLLVRQNDDRAWMTTRGYTFEQFNLKQDADWTIVDSYL